MKEKTLHINCKELLAVYYSLRSFETYFQEKHVKIFSDSRVGVHIINKMGRTESSICNDIVMNIWLFCFKNKIWITAAQITGAENVITGYESRKSYKDAEWMLNPEIFQKEIKHVKCQPDLDCFASRLNTQQPKYISYEPDPYAYLIYDFSVRWGLYKYYLFPPFSLIGRTFQGIHMDQTEVILVVPKWPTQPWFNTFQGMLSQEPYVVTPQKENLIIPQKTEKLHPLWSKRTLLIAKVSGKYF